jgi:hypothetical protein
MVALKRSTWREGGQLLRISFTWSSKLSSKILSASSIARISTLFKLRLPSFYELN